jgi:hypothetical protein
MKNVFREIMERIIDRSASVVLDRYITADKTSPCTKIVVKKMYLSYQDKVKSGDSLPSI